MSDSESSRSKFTLDSSDTPKMVQKAIKWARPNRLKWLEIADQGDSFFAGHQWKEEDEEYLRSQDRPVVTFNRILKTVLLIVGVEIAHRQEPLCVARNPTNPGQKELAEMCTTWVRYALDACGGDEERTWAFFDAVRRGIGLTELSMEYDEDPDGKMMLSRVDSLDYWWDVSARKPGHKDTRWRGVRRFMPYEEILMRFGEEKADALSTAEFDTEDEPERVVNVSPIGYAPGNTSSPAGKHAGPYLVTQFQWWEHERFYRIPDPNDQTGKKLMSVSKDGLARAEKLAAAMGNPNPVKVEQWRKKYRQTFVCGDVDLDTNDLPVPDFTLLPITGLFDEKKKLWFGVVKNMVDPQEWANKFFSQIMDILNRGRKNPLLVKKDAVDNPRQFERDINGPGALAVVNDLEGIKEMGHSDMPSALPYLFENALRAIPDVSGVNVELLGQSEGDQPGVTGQQRQTQGLTVLAPFFNSERSTRIKETRLIIEYGRLFIADGRLIHLIDQTDAPAIPLFRETMSTDYNLILDENPHNPNMRMAMWQEMTPILQIAIKGGLFGLISKIFSFAPYPNSIINEIQKELDMLEKQKQGGQNPFAPQKAYGQGGGKGGGAQPNPQLDQAKIAKLGTAGQVDLARVRALDAASRLKGFAVGADAAEQIHKMGIEHQAHAGSMREQQHRIARDNHAHLLDQFGKVIEQVKAAQEPDTNP